MRLDMQVKLLRVLQEQQFDRLGGATSLEADTRIIAATHRDLEQMVAAGTFREDLYYRLNVVPIEMPPLRERREDIPLLIGELNNRLEGRGMAGRGFSDAALEAMMVYDWPGNVRELANVVERCAILVPGSEAGLGDLPAKIRRAAGVADAAPVSAVAPAAHDSTFELPAVGDEGVELKGLLETLEMRLISQALDQSAGVVAQAARLLGLRRTTLVEKIRKFGIERAMVGSP
jgi:sigma-54 specific flagellar transcriptional regulator A